MVLISIVLDIITVLNYVLQYQIGKHFDFIFYVGIGIQAVIAITLLLFAITYKGQKNLNIPLAKNDVPTLRYSVIMASFIINIPLIFLYVLNLMGNPIVFGG
ncbi:hypothetical protein [Lentilactobacillus sp. Marseille-Q4993]|uniref:hypothetical protein n=1 Tax=Lentilactobacillus sp. Marseille-Q4993 TaxID=3039492 RepID=UPI0024BCAC69|nr:hypothetical protein [Lentilactobacillus sp. Marseille-Q4993]